MNNLITLLCMAATLALQYFLSIWLIRIGYFYDYAHTFGGFWLLMIIYGKSVSYILDLLKIKFNYRDSMIFKNSIFLFLILTFWLNYELIKIHYKHKTEIKK